jgi:hypothetical protein
MPAALSTDTRVIALCAAVIVGGVALIILGGRLRERRV